MANSIASQAGASAARCQRLLLCTRQMVRFIWGRTDGQTGRGWHFCNPARICALSAPTLSTLLMSQSLAVPRWEVPGGPGVSC